MENTFLSHHGIKGQRWGVRRFQNEDGSLVNGSKQLKQRMSTGKKVAIGIGASAAVVGVAWYIRNKGTQAKKAAAFAKESSRKLEYAKRAQKAAATRKARKSVGYYKNYKTSMDYSKMPTLKQNGSDFVKKSFEAGRKVIDLLPSPI